MKKIKINLDVCKKCKKELSINDTLCKKCKSEEKLKCEVCKEQIEGQSYKLDDLNVCEYCYHEALDCDDCRYDEHKISEEDDLAKFKEEKTKEDYRDEEYHRQKEVTD